MNRSRIYLDHNASSPLLTEARNAVVAALDATGNPSSVHSEGRAARSLLDQARTDVASLVGSTTSAVTFTSGATEAVATCLVPRWFGPEGEIDIPRLAVLETDHPCVFEGGRFPPDRLTRLSVCRDGSIDLDALDSWLDAGPPGLLALCVANSETGVLQPLDEIAKRTSTSRTLLVCDSSQMAGRVRVDCLSRGADAVILSAHKMGGPKGIGAFVLRDEGLRPSPLLTGGAQETRQRAGTEAISLIAGFGAAARVAADEAGSASSMTQTRGRLEQAIAALSPDFVFVGTDALRLPQTSMVHHPVLRAETLQIALDLAGFAVSAGSACSSGKLGSSHVLDAMARAGAPIDPSMGGIRISFGRRTTDVDIELFLRAFETAYRRLSSAGERRRVA